MNDQDRVISFDDLVASATFPVDAAMRDKIKTCYDREIETMNFYAKNGVDRGHKVKLVMDSFSGNDTQCQNFFSVSAMDLPVDNKINWYGQNTSRWLYAGCIAVYASGEVSTHH